MNDPIVSPWLVYFINQWPHFQGWLEGLGIITGSVLVLGFIAWLITLDGGVESEDHKEINRFVKKWLYVAIPAVFLAICIPTQSTVIQMLCANEVTKENITKVITLTGDVHDVVAEEIKDIKNELKADLIEIIKESTKTIEE